jgi:hypothetical protein
VQAPKASGRCVCAFDFDHTLRVEEGGRQDAPARDAKGIIADCQVRSAGAALRSTLGLNQRGRAARTQLLAARGGEHLGPTRARLGLPAPGRSVFRPPNK